MMGRELIWNDIDLKRQFFFLTSSFAEVFWIVGSLSRMKSCPKSLWHCIVAYWPMGGGGGVLYSAFASCMLVHLDYQKQVYLSELCDEIPFIYSLLLWDRF
jgi:hypothetical protein